MATIKHFPFLQLPLELRELIYHEVLRGTLRQDALASDIDDSILRTCKQIHAEARPVLYKYNVFEVAIWLPIPVYTPWPLLPANQTFLSKVQNLALYWDMRQFINVKFIRFESSALRKSILSLKQICMALLRAGTKLRTLKVTVKVPEGIDFGHLPFGQYPLLSSPIPFIERQLPDVSGMPADMLAPLKELRVQQAIFKGDFSEATNKTLDYFHDIKAILEGYKPDGPWVFPERRVLNVDLMIRRNLYYYPSAEGHPSWEGTIHRELHFYAETLRTYYYKNDELGEKLDHLRNILINPAIEKPKGIDKIEIGPALLLLEDIFQQIIMTRPKGLRAANAPLPQDLLAARDYFMARLGIPEIMERAKLAASRSTLSH